MHADARNLKTQAAKGELDESKIELKPNEYIEEIVTLKTNYQNIKNNFQD